MRFAQKPGRLHRKPESSGQMFGSVDGKQPVACGDVEMVNEVLCGIVGRCFSRLNHAMCEIGIEWSDFGWGGTCDLLRSSAPK
jgi:hypothetical protein